MLRILDANFNRTGEGLRVLEDVCRLVLNNPELSERLKSLRHELQPRDRSLQEKLVSARRAEEDVGAFIEEEGEGERRDLAGIVRANSRRVQQSLRVIEETLKLPSQDLGLNWETAKRARFKLYELEQDILLTLLRHERRQRISGLYLVLDTAALGERGPLDVAGQAIEGGARVIQLRDKASAKGQLIALSRQLAEVCARSGTLFVVNDHLDVAIASDADGLHVGQGDLPVDTARRLLPQGKILGCSAATLDEAVHAEEQGADYVAVGRMYPTSSKEDTRPAGPDTLRRVKHTVSIPVVAIGGINEHNVLQVIDAGADSIAVISAVLGAADVREASRTLAAAIEGEDR
jgi:thiamine-phosphate pyrophosphorylase